MRLWREQPVSYGPVETLTPSNVRTLPSSVGPVWLPLSRCSRHGRKAATWQHRKCARKSADSKRSLSPSKKADKVPAKPQSCEVRTTVFGWTRTRFPLHIRSTRKLTVSHAPVVTVIGKAFWDIGHAPKDQSNRRKRLPDYAVLEIHPVMKLTVQKLTAKPPGEFNGRFGIATVSACSV
jgi:hypothetical protein